MTSELREKAELAVRKYRDEIEMHDGLTNYKTAVHFATEMLRERAEPSSKPVATIENPGPDGYARIVRLCDISEFTSGTLLYAASKGDRP